MLLVVDDENTVCRALTRILKGKVGQIWTATNAVEAESILKSGSITHVICDHWFGPGQPLGMDLVKQWKNTYGSIKRAIVLTGTPIEKLKDNDGVDKVLSKVVDPEDLIRLLELQDTQSEE